MLSFIPQEKEEQVVRSHQLKEGDIALLNYSVYEPTVFYVWKSKSSGRLHMVALSEKSLYFDDITRTRIPVIRVLKSGETLVVTDDCSQ